MDRWCRLDKPIGAYKELYTGSKYLLFYSFEMNSTIDRFGLVMVPKEEFNDNLGLHYTKQGEGPPAVLVHGFAASNFDWAYLEPDLVENGYRVYSPDLIGHGNSIRSKLGPGYTFDLIIPNDMTSC